MLPTAYNLPTDDEDSEVEILLNFAPYSQVGTMKLRWIPVERVTVNDPSSWLSQTWRYTLLIEKVSLYVPCKSFHLECTFHGEHFVSEDIEIKQVGIEVDLNEQLQFQVESCTQIFIDELLNDDLDIHILVTPFNQFQFSSEFSTSNELFLESLGWIGDEQDHDSTNVTDYQKENEMLKEELSNKTQELEELKTKYEKQSKLLKELTKAKELDCELNPN